MRGVLAQVSAGAAEKILDSANPREIRSLTEGCVRCSEDEREHSKRDEGARVPRGKSWEPVCRRNGVMLASSYCCKKFLAFLHPVLRRPFVEPQN